MNTPTEKPQTFIFFGITGSGKGTQVELLEKYIKEKDASSSFVRATTGNEYRALITGDSYTGKLVVDNYNKGHLQPDFLTDALFTKILISEINPESMVITDGYPRTIPQSKVFEEAMNFYQRNGVKVIYIEVGKEEATKRMKLRGRADDTDEGIAKRFDEYVNNVIPSMNYFKDKSGYTIYTINGEQSIEDVHKELIAKIGL